MANILSNSDIRSINRDVRNITDNLKRPNGVTVYKINRVETAAAIADDTFTDPFSSGPMDVTSPVYNVEKIAIQLDAVVQYVDSDRLYAREPVVDSINADCYIIVKVQDSSVFELDDIVEIEGQRYQVIKKTPRGFRYPNRIIFDCRKIDYLKMFEDRG